MNSSPEIQISVIVSCVLQYASNCHDWGKALKGNQFRSGCPIASSLEIIGDRWTMVILRDLANGKRRSGDFMNSPEGIASNILATRLQAMEANGLIRSRLYSSRPKRYEYFFTAKGAALLPVLQALSTWGEVHLPKRWKAPEAFMNKRPQDLV